MNNSKLRNKVDLRRSYHLIKHDYAKNNHHVATILDATQQTVAKRYFYKLDCSNAYHGMRMADEQCIQILSILFAFRTIAWKRLAPGLNRSLSASTGVLREYLDPAVKTHRCARCVDNIGLAVRTSSNLSENFDLLPKQIQKAGLKLLIEKRQFLERSFEKIDGSSQTAGITLHRWAEYKIFQNSKSPNQCQNVSRVLWIRTSTDSNQIIHSKWHKNWR